MRTRTLWPAAALALAACATNPATGKTQLSFIGESQEIAMGRDAAAQVDASIGLYPDSALQAYVQRVGARLAATSERPDLPWRFRVVDDQAVNAFALPGGFIYVTRGILADLNNEAELASVIGHEIGHVTARHSVNQASKAQLAQLGLAVGVLVKPELERYAGVAQAGLGLLFLKFSRDDESQADQLGLRYMRRAGYDPRQMPDVFTLLTRVSQTSGGSRVPEWLETHPDPENRYATMSRAVAAIPPDSLGTIVDRAAYLRQIDGVVYGADPRQGYFEGSEFVHPALAFRVRFPDGWQTANQHDAVLGVSQSQDAMIQISVAAEGTAAAAAQAFFAQGGVTGGAPTAIDLSGLPAAGGAFGATTQDGTALSGTVVFVAHRGTVLRLLGYATAAGWSGYAATVRRAIGSFTPVTDRAVLGIKPNRIRLVKLDRAMTLAEFARRYPSTIPLEQLALVNQAQTDTRFAAGDLVKRVTK